MFSILEILIEYLIQKLRKDFRATFSYLAFALESMFLGIGPYYILLTRSPHLSLHFAIVNCHPIKKIVILDIYIIDTIVRILFEYVLTQF